MFYILHIGLFMVTALLFLGQDPSVADSSPLKERLVAIDKQDLDFSQAIGAIAEQAGVTIILHGQATEVKKNLTINEMPLDQALSRTLRVYGVQSHATVFDRKNGTLTLTLVGVGEQTSTTKYLPRNDASIPSRQTYADEERTDADTPADKNLSKADAYAEEYHKKVKSQQEPVKYPEGLSQEEINDIGKELMEF